MGRRDIRTVEDLLREYHDAERALVGEFSSDMATEVEALDEDMPVIASNLGVPWHGCDCVGTYYGWDHG